MKLSPGIEEFIKYWEDYKPYLNEYGLDFFFLGQLIEGPKIVKDFSSRHVRLIGDPPYSSCKSIKLPFLSSSNLKLFRMSRGRFSIFKIPDNLQNSKKDIFKTLKYNNVEIFGVILVSLIEFVSIIKFKEIKGTFPSGLSYKDLPRSEETTHGTLFLVREQEECASLNDNEICISIF